MSAAVRFLVLLPLVARLVAVLIEARHYRANRGGATDAEVRRAVERVEDGGQQ